MLVGTEFFIRPRTKRRRDKKTFLMDDCLLLSERSKARIRTRFLFPFSVAIDATLLEELLVTITEAFRHSCLSLAGKENDNRNTESERDGVKCSPGDFSWTEKRVHLRVKEQKQRSFREVYEKPTGRGFARTALSSLESSRINLRFRDCKFEVLVNCVTYSLQTSRLDRSGADFHCVFRRLVNDPAKMRLRTEHEILDQPFLAIFHKLS